jgi:hypothetical protein
MQSIRSIESTELRQLLLLLRDDLDDEDIPKRDKIHDAIISAWKVYYLSLKKDLKVSFFFSFFPWQWLTSTLQGFHWEN